MKSDLRDDQASRPRDAWSGPLSWARALALTVSLLLVATVTSVVVASPVSADDGGRCVGGIYRDAGTAKAHFDDDCGQPFAETIEHRCDWVPGGWQCQGPGRATDDTGGDDDERPPVSSKKPPSPVLIEVEKEGDYVNVVWRSDSRIRGVNVHRNGRFLGSVNSPNNVFNHFGGRSGDSYELVAYGYDTDEYSDRVVAIATNNKFEPVRNLTTKAVGVDKVELSFSRANSETVAWLIFRNGKLWRSALAFGYLSSHRVVDNNAEDAFVYQVQACSTFKCQSDRDSPKVFIFGPATLDEMTRDGRAREITPWKGNNTPLVSGLPASNGTQRSLAAQAERSSADAHVQYKEFEDARAQFIQSGANMITPSRLPAVFSLPDFVEKGLEMREQRMEAEEAFEKAFDDLEEYEKCVSSNCGAIQAPSNGGGDGGGDGGGGSSNERTENNQRSDGTRDDGSGGGTRSGDQGDGLRG